MSYLLVLRSDQHGGRSAEKARWISSRKALWNFVSQKASSSIIGLNKYGFRIGVTAPFRREDSLAFMNIGLVKFHEAVVNVPYRVSGVSTPGFMDVEWVQGFSLRRKVHRYCELTTDCEIYFRELKSL